MSIEITTIPDHAQRAVGRLRQMNGPRVQAIAQSLGASCQDLEDVIVPMGPQRYLANATGSTLDAIGALRNIPRQGLDDTTYRNVITGAIAAQTSKGLTENVINAAIGLFSAQAIFVRTPNSASSAYAPAAVVAIGIGSGTIPQNALGLSLNLLNQSLGAGIAIDQVFSFDASGVFAMAGPQPWVQGFDVGGFAQGVYQNPTL